MYGDLIGLLNTGLLNTEIHWTGLATCVSKRWPPATASPCC